MNDYDFMEEAFSEALTARERGECPVGAVLVRDGKIVARAGNEERASKDPTAHAEMLCLRRAGKEIGSHELVNCVMYTTLWPCPMCQSAMLQAQVKKVVAGSISFGWIFDIRFDDDKLEMVGPIKQKECRQLFIEWASENKRLKSLSMKRKNNVQEVPVTFFKH